MLPPRPIIANVQHTTFRQFKGLYLVLPRQMENIHNQFCEINQELLLARWALRLDTRRELPIFGFPIEGIVIRHDMAEPGEASVEHHHTSLVLGQAVQELDASIGARVAIEIETEAEPRVVDARAPAHTHSG